MIFRTGQLGDTIVSLPAMRAIKQAYPDASLYLLYATHVGRKQYVSSPGLLRGAGIFDGYIEYTVGTDTLIDRIRATCQRLRLIWDLRTYRFDKVIHLEPGYKSRGEQFRDKFYFRMAKIKEQVTSLSYRTPVVPGRPLATQENEADFFLRALREQSVIGRTLEGNPMDLSLGGVEANEVERWLNRGHGETDFPEKAIGVGIGSKMQSKRWPVERYQEVLHSLVESHGVKPIFLGGAEDSILAEQCIAELGTGLNACGQLSLRGSAKALEHCAFYLGNDTGTMHLAVAAGLKCVALFSARDYPGKWYPYGNGHKVHRELVDCEGCMLLECHEQQRKCLHMIQVEQILQSCRELLS